MVKAPGLPGLHRIDWLYSATGLSMEGSGIGLDGQAYHIDALGDGGWVTATGAATSPSDGWSAGRAVLAGRRLLAQQASARSPSRSAPAAGPTAAAPSTCRCAT